MDIQTHDAGAPRAPVLLVAFNRPEATARVFDAIRQARPPRLYVAADGPRASRPGEAALCAEVRRIASAVDWPCSLQLLFRDENLGCKRAVSSAIDWFFSMENRGIILEDDCVPSASFFRFCEELLERFQGDPRVFSVQGNFFGCARTPSTSYLFSKLFYMWGWATWSDRWKAVRVDGFDVEAVRRALDEENWLGVGFWVRNYWLDVLALQTAGMIDSWGNPAQFHCFASKLLNATPTKNLVLNIGTGSAATRTAQLEPGPFHRAALDIAFPLAHPARHEGAKDLLPFELRWRMQLSPWILVRQVAHYRFPRIYGMLRTMYHSLKPRARAT
jgi:hypothetical protein